VTVTAVRPADLYLITGAALSAVQPTNHSDHEQQQDPDRVLHQRKLLHPYSLPNRGGAITPDVGTHTYIDCIGCHPGPVPAYLHDGAQRQLINRYCRGNKVHLINWADLHRSRSETVIKTGL